MSSTTPLASQPSVHAMIGKVIRGDCLDVLREAPAECIDLAYLDPPFNTGRTLAAASAAYDDRWDDLDAYLAYMQPRIAEVCRVLKPHGSILLHCDWRTCHHFRFMLEALLGPESFVNHLIWSYGLGGSSPRRFARKHDDILFHAKGPEYHFQPPRIAATSNRMRGQQKKATDVLDVPAINNMAAERVGYPTQQPLALLTMLVEACSPVGGIVLDPFCGSGTTLIAAQQLGRLFIGIDRSADAVRISQQRIADAVQRTPG